MQASVGVQVTRRATGPGAPVSGLTPWLWVMQVLLVVTISSRPSAAGMAALPPFQPMVDAALPGSVVRPAAGRYAGPVVITKPLTIDGAHQVTIDGGGMGSVVVVRAAGVTLRRLHITGSGSSHDAMDSGVAVETDRVRLESNRVDDVLFGLELRGANDGVICGNTISSKPEEPGLRGDGIRIWNGRRNQVRGNDISNARDVTLANSRDNVIAGNRIRHGRFGLQLVFAPRNRIEHNWLDGNLTGIAAMTSDDLVIRHNLIQNSLGPAGSCLVFKDASQAVVEDNAVVHCSMGAHTNAPNQPLNVLYFRRNLFAHNGSGMDFYGENGGHVIEGNRFEHNLVQVSVSGAMSARGHLWRDNDWDDYEGFDQDADGVGDVPYEIYAYTDRLWMDAPHALFFRNSPMIELLDFLERLAPFVSPELVLRDPRPRMSKVAVRAQELQDSWKTFTAQCPGGEL